MYSFNYYFLISIEMLRNKQLLHDGPEMKFLLKLSMNKILLTNDGHSINKKKNYIINIFSPVHTKSKPYFTLTP